MQKEEYFLEYNENNIFKSFLQTEDHLRQLQNSPNFKVGFQNCIVKHLAFAEAEADEAVSHSLIVEGNEKSISYAKLRDEISLLRKNLQSGKISNDQAIKDVREARALFEKINPLYDMSKCQACGNNPQIEQLAKSLGNIEPNISNIENDAISKVVSFLSAKYNVPPPKIELLEDCHDPDKGLYTSKTIRLCSGGVSLRVLSHEFGHYMQDLNGQSLDEGEAEKFSLNFLAKELYSKSARYSGSELKMAKMSTKDVVLIYGSQHVGYGILQLLQMLNAYHPMANLLGDIVVTGVGLAAALKLKETYALPAAIIGGYVSTDLWKQAQILMAPTATTMRMNNFRLMNQNAVQPMMNNSTVQIKNLSSSSMGKYAMN